MTIKYYIFLLSIFLFSCIEEFQPNLDKFDNIVVVDGQITNEPGPYTIKLSISNDLNSTITNPINKATVKISSESGESELLSEIKPGTYQTKTNGIQGIIGEKYKISFSTLEGKSYESTFQELLSPTNIESVHGNVDNKLSIENNTETIGYQFYINTDTSTYEKNYYLWFFEGTYKFKTQFQIAYTYSGEITPILDPDSLRICYITYRINEFFATNTVGFETSKIVNKPIVFVDSQNEKLEIRYSLLTKQYSIGEEAFDFWNSIERQTSSANTLYTTQPYQIRGNVKNIDDALEPVLGYFMVAGVSQNRIFIDRPNEIPPPIKCFVQTNNLGEALENSVSDWPIFLTEDGGSLGIAYGDCIDCTVTKGASLKKPDFWVD